MNPQPSSSSSEPEFPSQLPTSGSPQPSSNQGETIPNAGYRPSVPISVYRALAEKLQVTEGELGQVQQENQRLVTQNQQLRQEIVRILQTAEQVQQTVQLLEHHHLSVSTPPLSPQPSSSKSPTSRRDRRDNRSSLIEAVSESSPSALSPPPGEPPSSPIVSEPESSSLPPKKPKPHPYGKKEVLDIQDTTYTELKDSSSTPNLNGWLIFVVTLVILLTAFGAGFFVMRPLLNQNQNSR